MEDINMTRWDEFKTAIRRHWPNLSDSELLATHGEFDKVEKLILSDTNERREDVRNLLAYIYDETQTGNPNTIDDYAGIEKAQQSPLAAESNEWKAREDENGPEPEEESHP